MIISRQFIHTHQGGHRIDHRGDLLIHRRNDLASVLQVDLVPVVLRRIVARGDHHSRGRPEVPNGECEDRGGQRAGEHEGLHSETLHGRRGVVGEDIGVVPGVVSDDDGAPRREVLGQVASQARGGLKDDDPIHAVGSGTEWPPKAGRSEVQAPGEAVRQL